jgi:hypothetical protein
MEIINEKIIPVTYTSLYKLVRTKQIIATDFAVGKQRADWKVKGEELTKFLQNRKNN